MPTTGTISSATGVIAMVLLTAGLLLGILIDRRVRLPGLPRFAGLSLHRYAALLALTFVGLHIVTAVAGRYARIGIAGAIVPFASGGDPLWIGIGAIGSDLMVALVVTSLLRRHLSRRTWRAVHWLAYACWPAAIAHSIGIGMRAGRLLDLAIACVIAVLGAVAWRVIAGLRRPRRPRSAPVIVARRPAAVRGRERPGALLLAVDPIGCTGHGLCAELLPELIALDQWGYPLVAADGRVPGNLTARARRAATDCPALALRLSQAGAPGRRTARSPARPGS
jgi:methionine sulfoxide reductase heme-binding subunit